MYDLHLSSPALLCTLPSCSQLDLFDALLLPFLYHWQFHALLDSFCHLFASSSSKFT